mmetsp:Transcript_18450/g.22593  ORF Transcript_18450/g.22593 Transcript_18450/m.22593 type:complete len:404 (-) Transcript_18450:74-1285(-)
MVNFSILAPFIVASTITSASAFVPAKSHSKSFVYPLQQSTRAAEAPEATKVVTNEQVTTSMPSPKREKILKEPALWEYNFGLQDPQLTLPHDIVPRVTSPEKFEVTEEQIQILERDGVLHIKGVFDDDWVDYLRQATSKQVDEPHFWAFAGTASKLYDYIQRNIWQTNKAFADFYYHSAMGHVLAQCGRTDAVRVSTDLLMVNPNKGFKWHQDNQNGPITWEDGIRFWITMDETPKEYGAPVYLKGSHLNNAVDEQAVFVDIEMKGLEAYKDKLAEFRTMPGDMLIWHPRTIHKVDGPADGIWTTYRRVLGGTVAKAGTKYTDKMGTGGVLSDLGNHGLTHGENMESPYFPIIYPQFDNQEAEERDNGSVGRSPRDIASKLGGLAGKASGDKFFSFFKVLGSR